MDLGQFIISYKPKTSLKGQAILDFIAKFTYKEEVNEMEPPQLIQPQDTNTSSSQNLLHLLVEVSIWIIHADGALNR